MSWVDDLPAEERAELRDAGRLGTARWEQTELWPDLKGCECPGVLAGYPFAHLPKCPRREAEPFA